MFAADRDPGREARHAKLSPAVREHAERLLALADHACRAVAEHDAGALASAMAEVDLSLGRDYDEYGTTMEQAPAAELFADAAAIHREISQGTSSGRTLALPLLAIVDPPTGAKLVLEGLALGQRDYFPNFVEAWLMIALAWSAEHLRDRLERGAMGELWVSGKLRLDRVTDEHIAAVSVARIAEAARGSALGYFHVDDARRVMAAHPALGSLDESVGFLEALEGAVESHAALAFTSYLLAFFTRHAHAPALPAVLRLFESTRTVSAGPRRLVYQSAVTALFALGHRPTLEALAAELAPRVAAAKPKWDPHHTIPELRDPIRATFAIDPATASERFRSYLEPPAITTEGGAKIAHDILSLGTATLTDHRGTRLETGDSVWIDRDPAWRDIVAGLVDDPRLGRLARSISKRLAPAKTAAKPRKRASKKRASKP